MPDDVYQKFRSALRQKIMAQKEKLTNGQIAPHEVAGEFDNYIWESFTETVPLWAGMSRRLADINHIARGNARKFCNDELDFVAYWHAKQETDEEFRKLELGTQYQAYRNRLEQALRHHGDIPGPKPPVVIDYPGDFKAKIFGFTKRIRVDPNHCPGVRVGPPAPKPIWPEGPKVFTYSTGTPAPELAFAWKPVPSDGCPLVYGLQIQEQQTTAPYFYTDIGPPVLHLTSPKYVAPNKPADGRWRVWATDANGLQSEQSPWQYFRFVQVADPLPLSFDFTPKASRRGQDVVLTLSRPETVKVYYNQRLLPKKVLDGGKTLILTVPGNAESGYFELEYQGGRIQAKEILTVLP